MSLASTGGMLELYLGLSFEITISPHKRLKAQYILRGENTVTS